MQRDERTYRIIGAAMAVHRALGPGLWETAYQEALGLEFGAQRIPFRREVPVQVTYRGHILGPARRVDFTCYDSVAVELKVASAIADAHIAQTLNYMGGTGMRTGLILNFGQASLEVKRLICGPPQPAWKETAAPFGEIP